MTDTLDPAGGFNAESTFDAWALARSGTKTRPLRAASAKKYRAVWQAWLRYLSAQHLDWKTADSSTLDQFVAAVPPRSARQDKASEITRTRYWRTVTAVYAHAELHALDLGDAEFVNPLSDAKPPLGARRDNEASAVLAPQHWQALYDARPAGQDWTVERDRAMLLLVLDTGITVQELRTLETRHVAWLGHGQPSKGSLVEIVGARRAQRRQLTVGPIAAQALAQWIERRATLASTTNALFLSRKGLGVASAMAIWHNIASLVQQAMHALGETNYHHAGPNVLRNAVLMRWLLEGVQPDEVARRAGLGTVHKLDRIIERCDDPTKARIHAALASTIEHPIKSVKGVSQ